MTSRYVAAGGSDANGGTNGTSDAWLTIKKATDTAAAGEIVYVSSTLADVISADTTYTLAANVLMVSVSDITTTPPVTYAAGATVDGSGTSAVDINLSGNGAWRGFTFKSGGSTGSGGIALAGADANYMVFDSCTFTISNSNSGSRFTIGPAPGSAATTICVTKGCTFNWGTSNGQTVNLQAHWWDYGSNLHASGTVPTIWITGVASTADSVFEGSNLSALSGTLFSNSTGPTTTLKFISCRLHASVTPATFSAAAAGDVYFYDCASGDDHYKFAHYNFFGSTVATTAYYASAKFDGTNGVGWLVSSTANATFVRPYVSPWIDVYNAATGAVTPYLDVIRNGASPAAYKDDEVWSEWSYPGNTGYPLASFVNDRREVVSANADQGASSLATGDWTGSDANDWFGKLSPTGAITPAEIGYVRARVCIGKASVTDFYVDPKIKGL